MFKPAWTWVGLAALMASTTHALTLEEAVTRALASHPEIERWEARSAAAAADRDVAAFAPPLVLSAETELPLGADEGSGVEVAEGTLGLSRVLERGGKRQRRREAGQQRFSRVELEVELQRVALVAETTRRFTAVVAAQAQMLVTSERLELAGDLLERVERRVAAARSSQAEAHGARMEVARARADVVHAEGALTATRARLAALWGEASPGFERAEADLFVLPKVPGLADGLAALARNPDLARLDADRRVADAEAELARSQRRSDVTVSAGARYFGELDTGGIAVGFSLPLGSRRRAEPAIRAAEQRSQASDLALEGRRRDLEGLVAELIARLDAKHQELTLLQDSVIPEAQSAVDLYRQGFDAGRHSVLAVAEAQRRLIGARGDAVQTASDFHRLMIELEILTRTVAGGSR